MDNPFTITFGKKPGNYIGREYVVSQIYDCFNSRNPFTQTYIITGVRGMGKTAALSSVSNRFKDDEEWIVIDLNPARDLQEDFAAKLYDVLNQSGKYEIGEINPSAFGISLITVRKKEDPLFNIEVLTDQLLQNALKKDKKVLITIDEVSNTNEMKRFALSFQAMLRNDFPVFLLMTGLYQNVMNLQNDKMLTFLYRAEKISLESLNLSLIKESYMNIFDMSEKKAKMMASLTGGYPFAYQVLGNLVWNNREKALDELMNTYDSYLQSYVYDKIWAESSGKDRLFMKAMTEMKGKTKKISGISKNSGMSESSASVYRDRLIKKGLIVNVRYGEVKFALPRFEEFIILKTEFDEDFD